MAKTETAILAGGCFWGTQDLIRKLPGVTATRVGYSGGDVPNATYRNHGSHAEAIEVVFEPAKREQPTVLRWDDVVELVRRGNVAPPRRVTFPFPQKGRPAGAHADWGPDRVPTSFLIRARPSC